MSIVMAAYLRIRDFLKWREENAHKATRRAVDEILSEESLDCLRRAVPNHRRRAAVHEAGHAVAVAALIPNRLNDVEIDTFENGVGERSGEAFGYTKIFTAVMSRKEREGLVTVLYAGIAAERLLLGEHLDGCGNDLESAARLALETSCFWMAPTPIDPSVCDNEATRTKVLDILSRANADAEKIVADRRPAVEAVAKALEEKGSLKRDEILRLVNATR